jgi:hypothetical protein
LKIKRLLENVKIKLIHIQPRRIYTW